MKQFFLDEGCSDLIAHCRCTPMLGLPSIASQGELGLSRPLPVRHGAALEDGLRHQHPLPLHFGEDSLDGVGVRQIVGRLTRLIIGVRSRVPVMC